LILGAVSAAAAAAPKQKAPPPPAWTDRAPDPAVVNGAGIGVPRQAGSLKMIEVRDLGTEGLDDVAQYASADQAISGTIFIYFPALPDTGLTFLATDETIRRRFGPETKIADDRLVTVAGVPKAGRRIVYSGASDGLRSTAALFIRAGGWILVLRVSGPASRAAEISEDLDAVAAGLTFAKDPPLPAHVIQTESCPDAGGAEARVTKPSGSEAMEFALLVAGGQLRDERHEALPDLLERVPDRLCLARSGSRGEGIVLTYRTVGKASGLFAPRVFDLVGDAGTIVEFTATSKAPERLVALRHAIGETTIYGIFLGEPNLAQIDRLIEHDTAFPAFAQVELKPSGNSDVHLACKQFAEGCPQSKPKPGGAADAQPSTAASPSR
jgi:hypothetical protein